MSIYDGFLGTVMLCLVVVLLWKMCREYYRRDPRPDLVHECLFHALH